MTMEHVRTRNEKSEERRKRLEIQKAQALSRGSSGSDGGGAGSAGASAKRRQHKNKKRPHLESSYPEDDDDEDDDDEDDNALPDDEFVESLRGRQRELLETCLGLLQELSDMGLGHGHDMIRATVHDLIAESHLQALPPPPPTASAAASAAAAAVFRGRCPPRVPSPLSATTSCR